MVAETIVSVRLVSGLLEVTGPTRSPGCGVPVTSTGTNGPISTAKASSFLLLARDAAP